jgi:hypothetical protein
MDNVFISLLENLVFKPKQETEDINIVTTKRSGCKNNRTKTKHKAKKRKKDNNDKNNDKIDYLESRIQTLEAIVENRTDFLGNQIKQMNQFFFKKDFH